MPNNNLILRTLTSPYGDTTLGSVLSHADLDNNLIFLKGEIINSASVNNSILTLTKLDGNTVNVSLGNIAGGDTITGGTFSSSAGTLTLINSTGGTVSISGFATTYTNSTPTTATVGGISAGSTFNSQTMQQMWDALLYPYQAPAFSSFSLQGISSPYEIGQSIGVSQTFLWGTTNSSNVATNSISLNGYNLTTLSSLANDGSEAITFLNPITRDASDGPGTRAWGISGISTSGVTFTSSLSIRWDYRMFAGTSTNTSLTGPQILALTDYNSVKNGFAGTYNMSAGGYKYFCFAATYGSPSSFKDNATGFNLALYNGYPNPDIVNGGSYDLVAVTNAYGETTNYKVYRSLNILGSTIDIKIT